MLGPTPGLRRKGYLFGLSFSVMKHSFGFRTLGLNPRSVQAPDHVPVSAPTPAPEPSSSSTGPSPSEEVKLFSHQTYKILL